MAAWTWESEREEGEERSGERRKKGHHGFKVACPGGKLWDMGTSV
jgi:hypothetical protein